MWSGPPSPSPRSPAGSSTGCSRWWSAASPSGILPTEADFSTNRSQTKRETSMRRQLGALAMVAALCTAGGVAEAKDKLTLQLKWVTQAQFAGYFVARDKGFYDDA